METAFATCVCGKEDINANLVDKEYLPCYVLYMCVPAHLSYGENERFR